jgi:hypothetical protein
MDVNILNSKFEEFKNKFESNNLGEIINLGNEMKEFIKKNSTNKQIKLKKNYYKMKKLYLKLLNKKLKLKSQLKKNINYVSTNNDYYYEDNNSSSYIEGTNYVVYGSDLDPLEDPFQDLLDFCN